MRDRVIFESAMIITSLKKEKEGIAQRSKMKEWMKGEVLCPLQS